MLKLHRFVYKGKNCNMLIPVEIADYLDTEEFGDLSDPATRGMIDFLFLEYKGWFWEVLDSEVLIQDKAQPWVGNILDQG